MYRFRTIMVAAGAAAALALGVAPAAMATTPTPSATPTVTPSPAPLRLLHLRPETFIIHTSTADPGGAVVAVGPVRGTGTGAFGRTSSVLSLTGPVGTVRLLHTRLAPLVVDLASCTASSVTTGRWALIGRSGADVRAFGFGTYRASVVAILARGLFGRCLGLSLRARPVAVDTQVIGTGQAAQLRLGLFAPRLTPALAPAA